MAMLRGVCLASRSPRRRELLRQIEVVHEVLDVDVEEVQTAGELPEDFVCRVALDKARAGWQSPRRPSDWPVLGADTVVVVDGQVLGKPVDRAHALAMLARLSGRAHRVLTGVAIVQGEHERRALSCSEVRFRELTVDDCETYWASGEPADKAGAYAIQGKGAVFVSELRGSYSGVMGLPLYETASLLGEFGIDVI